MSELPDSLKDVNSVLKRGREVLNVIEPKLKHCNVAAVMCNKIYTQAELDQRIEEAVEQACREQREACRNAWGRCESDDVQGQEKAILSATNTSEGE